MHFKINVLCLVVPPDSVHAVLSESESHSGEACPPGSTPGGTRVRLPLTDDGFCHPVQVVFGLSTMEPPFPFTFTGFLNQHFRFSAVSLAG